MRPLKRLICSNCGSREIGGAGSDLTRWAQVALRRDDIANRLLKRPIARIRAAEDRNFNAAVIVFPFDAPVAGIEAILKYLGWFRHAGAGATPPSTPAGRDCPHPRRLLAFARGGACTFRGDNGSRTGGGSMRSSRPTLRGTRVRT